MNSAIIEAAAWECKSWGDSVSAFRVHMESNQAECYSNNGRDCLWVTSMYVCRGNMVDFDGKMVAQPLKPLRCGPMYEQVWGMSGNNETHWCKAMYPSLALMPQAASTPASGGAGMLRVTLAPLPLTVAGKSAATDNDIGVWPAMLCGVTVIVALGAIALVIFMWKKKKQQLVNMTAKAPAYQLKEDNI
ncbi:hypothetical protein H257_03528 [Aphanomyces astaci]|uniref:Uncharacterized protein n=1 Tax=Aphanomyces astaci TaxID=112090 RepID=W4GZB7_APHAT|nr:hypothetical protein H257_03528 [Aphanomyces astaci]ETV84273.1 hypothetical protein H257_03528 [Aphanomyces astaci]KAF0706238.1 hypothetical protein AaE_014217 [Aphanomyces astaci]RHY92359.1 hypothetical protein DYB35_001135 [Aphanomyces astaci]RHZ24765.1 hypothetical protein DYB37_000003 [Aphanomyces astaci]|eukprot:XP_009825965.1 hypothetical protein H257_03528 [Aphanomyces astaci]